MKLNAAVALACLGQKAEAVHYGRTVLNKDTSPPYARSSQLPASLRQQENDDHFGPERKQVPKENGYGQKAHRT